MAKKYKKEEIRREWKKKQFNDNFVREIKEARSQKPQGQIMKGHLKKKHKKKTEGLMFSTQEQFLRMNCVRKNMNGLDISEICRMHGTQSQRKDSRKRRNKSYQYCKNCTHKTMPEVRVSWGG